ncbi:hypothetical protein [Marinobacter sp. JSM 1782161]|uniref:hypothetical protein n=1 Tax=Marinobacter sp. JSM 1782161 TaxID=2685906 RepID=UPI0014025287|nr:hypothetical protein [Marinobacter sp. JSM 1782161]
MCEIQQQTRQQEAPVPDKAQVRMPEFYMPAMPPLALTEALDRWLKLWARRRRFRRLLQLNDQQLGVLGVTREALMEAARQPLQEDAFEVLARRLQG